MDIGGMMLGRDHMENNFDGIATYKGIECHQVG
jgi:hypothetical protein